MENVSVKRTQRISSEKRIMIRTFRKKKLAVIGLVIIVLFILVAVFAPLIAPYDPYQIDILNAKQDMSWAHWMGTDALGRDVLSRVIYGARTSLLIAVVAVGLSAIVGIGLGLLAGYLGGILEVFIMRFLDALMSIPMTILALAIAALLGGGLVSIIIATGVGMTCMYARIMYGQTLQVKTSDYIMAEMGHGAKKSRIMLQHILPNCFPVIIVTMTTQLGSAIMMEAGLSFLGIGILPPTPSWGGMINEGFDFLMTHPILSIGPGIAIFLVVFAFNMFGDGLRDALDPRLRGVI